MVTPWLVTDPRTPIVGSTLSWARPGSCRHHGPVEPADRTPHRTRLRQRHPACRAAGERGAVEVVETSGSTLLAAGRAAGVGHYVVLSIVDLDGFVRGGSFRAEKVQENPINDSGLPTRSCGPPRFSH